MTTKPAYKPWHEVVQLRDDLKTGELSLAVFAADLYDVVMQKGQRPVYEHPAEFFALTYPTYNLRELVKDVALRLAGTSDKAYRKLAVNYGGGKTHTLIALRHLVHDPVALPDLPAVKEFEAHIGFKAPKARVAALCFDKIDLEKGVETPSPDGTVRMLKHPWSILAFQLAGADGLRLIHADGKDAERDTPPAEPLVAELLSKPQQDNLSTLVLLDEVLMYIRAQVEVDPEVRGRLISFFQYLTQAVVKVDRCAMVASLLASDPRKHDDFGNELLRDMSEVFGRQTEEDASPVGKEDVAEVLRRRFFKPESIRDPSVFRPHVTAVVGSIAALDEQTQKERASAEERYLSSYPFHPDLTDIFYTRWTQLNGFQRTRGILRTFAIALRDAEKWDTSPLVGPNVFLNEPKKNGLAEAAGELASFASVDTNTGKHQAWRPILEGELAKAHTIQSEATGLSHRQMEQAVIAVFLSSQPIGHKILTQEYLGWEEVRDQLKNQPIDPIREQMLTHETESARKRVPEAIRQAYSVVVTVNERNEIHAFKVVVTDEPLFTTIKADPRARIQETAICSEAMVPGGPYDLWREGEDARRVKDLVGAFAQFPKLPKMLRQKEILDTVVQGVQQGIWVARVARPDHTARTFWRTAIDEPALKDSGLEVLLPEATTLSDLAPDLLGYQKLPGLWSAAEISVQDVCDYFAGGHTVSVPREGYEEILTIPKCEPAEVEAAIAQAIEQGLVWLTSGPASILKEPVPAGVLSAAAILRPPPERIAVDELMAKSLPDAWKDSKTNALALATALSTKRGVNLPWSTVQAAIEDGIRARWIELSNDSAAWPCDLAGAQQVILQVPSTVREELPVPKPQGRLMAEDVLEANGIQDLADQIPSIAKAAVGNALKFNVRIEFGGETAPDPAAVEEINALLAEVSGNLRLN